MTTRQVLRSVSWGRCRPRPSSASQCSLIVIRRQYFYGETKRIVMMRFSSAAKSHGVFSLVVGVISKVWFEVLSKVAP
jgi:hypothetical protein